MSDQISQELLASSGTTMRKRRRQTAGTAVDVISSSRGAVLRAAYSCKDARRAFSDDNSKINFSTISCIL